MTGDIWVFDLRGAAQPRKMTFEGDDASPLWSKDGSRLFFYSIRGGTRVVAGGFMGSPHWYDVANDGRFLLIKRKDSVPGTGDASLVVTLNWVEDLKRLAPAR